MLDGSATLSATRHKPAPMPIFKANDAELHYEDTGSGEPVLLLHGLGGSSADWTPQVEALVWRYRALTLDVRCGGRSRDLAHPAGPWSVKQFADDAAGLLDHLGAEPAHIVGLSMGGIIAFQLAVDHPRLVRSLTLVNCVPQLVPRTLKQRWTVWLRMNVARLFGPAGVARMIAPKLFPRPDQADLRQRFLKSMERNDPRAYSATQRALIGWSVLDRIDAIEAPTLMVASERDYWPVAEKQGYARQMKRAEVVVVPGVGHALPIEAPDEFNRILIPFLDTQAGQRDDTSSVPLPHFVAAANRHPPLAAESRR